MLRREPDPLESYNIVLQSEATGQMGFRPLARELGPRLLMIIFSFRE